MSPLLVLKRTLADFGTAVVGVAVGAAGCSFFSWQQARKGNNVRARMAVRRFIGAEYKRGWDGRQVRIHGGSRGLGRG